MTITLPTLSYRKGELRPTNYERPLQVGDQIIAINYSDEPHMAGDYRRAYQVTEITHNLSCLGPKVTLT